MIRKELLESFWLYETKGKSHRAYIYQEHIDTSDHSGSSSILGLKTCRLDNGTPMNHVDDDTFKNVVTGELLSRTEPRKN